MINDTCLVTVAYPKSKVFLKRFVKTINLQEDKLFDVVIFFNKTIPFKLNLKNKTKSFKLNSSIVSSRIAMINVVKKMSYKKIIFLDFDDTMRKNRVRVLKHKLDKYKIVVNDFNIVNKKKIIRNYLSKRIRDNYIIKFNDIKNHNFLGMTNTAVQNTLLKKISFKKSYKVYVFDWLFWSLLINKTKAIFTKKTSTNYYVKNKSLTCLPSILNKKNIEKIKIIREKHFKALSNIIKQKDYISKITKNDKYNFWWELKNEK